MIRFSQCHRALLLLYVLLVCGSDASIFFHLDVQRVCSSSAVYVLVLPACGYSLPTRQQLYIANRSRFPTSRVSSAPCFSNLSNDLKLKVYFHKSCSHTKALPIDIEYSVLSVSPGFVVYSIQQNAVILVYCYTFEVCE